MAIHANSTPAPERTLLRETCAPGRLLPGPVTPAHALDLLAINDRIAALFNPAEIGPDEPGEFDGPLCETMREWQDDELSSLKAQRAEIEAKRAADLLAILDAGPLPHVFMSRSQRKAMQAGVDALIDYLDAITPDCDLEPTMGHVGEGHLDEAEGDYADDEECLGWPPYVSQTHFGINTPDGDHTAPERYGIGFVSCSADDMEITCEDEGADTGDREPELGALERTDQRSWAESSWNDDEPTLGSPEVHHDQRRWGQGRGSRELDCDERAGLRSFGMSEARQRTEQIRRDTETMLRRKRPGPRSHVLCDRNSDLILFMGGFSA